MDIGKKKSSISTLDGSGHNRTKGIVERGGNTNSRAEGQDRGRLGQKMGVGRNGSGEEAWGGQDVYRRKN